jgi:uncharacterized membrane protein HdeD (DUF308 family)
MPVIVPILLAIGGILRLVDEYAARHTQWQQWASIAVSGVLALVVRGVLACWIAAGAAQVDDSSTETKATNREAAFTSGK